jgi:hypothetical protein
MTLITDLNPIKFYQASTLTPIPTEISASAHAQNHKKKSKFVSPYKQGDFTFIQEYPSSSTDDSVQRLTFVYGQLRYVPLHIDPKDVSQLNYIRQIIEIIKLKYVDKGFKHWYFNNDLIEIEYIQRYGWDNYYKQKSSKLKNRNPLPLHN